MLLLIKIEIKKISKSKLFNSLVSYYIYILGITGIIIMGLGTDNKIGRVCWSGYQWG